MRLQVLRLFQQEIYPKRKVQAHFLTHGVTRARLKAQLANHRGYHIVHWINASISAGLRSAS